MSYIFVVFNMGIFGKMDSIAIFPVRYFYSLNIYNIINFDF